LRSISRPDLTRVGVDHADVLLALRALEHDLLHVDADLLHPGAVELDVDELQELLDVPEQLLGYALHVEGQTGLST